MRLIVGCPVKERGWALPHWFNSLWEQNIDMEIVCLYSESSDDTLDYLHDGGATILMDTSPGRPVHEIDGHVWGLMDTYAYMAEIRNRLLSFALEEGADLFFSLDSDILLPPRGLQTLLDILADRTGCVSPAVNMVRDQTVWNLMHWQPSSGSAFRSQAVPQKTSRVDVIMAAMLMDRVGMESHWLAHPQGEDLGYCRVAASKQVPLWWVPEVTCQHLMDKLPAPV